MSQHQFGVDTGSTVDALRALVGVLDEPLEAFIVFGAPEGVASSKRGIPRPSHRARGPDGRSCGATSLPRSGGTSFAPIVLPGEEKRGLAQDLLLLFENLDLTAKTDELGSLRTGETFPETLIDFGLADPGAKCADVDPELRAQGRIPL